MDKIRIGNDIHIEWSIFRDNQPEVFEGKDVEVRLIHTRIRDVIPLEWVISDGVVSATFYGKDQIDTGDYKLMLIENNGLPNMATIDECKAFSLVQCSCQEEKEEPSTSLQLHKVQLSLSFALSGGGNISVEGYPNVDELEEVKELSGNENIIITDSEGNKKTTIGNLKEYVVKDISELPPFRIFENESDYNAVKDELGDCVVCLRDTGVLLYHVYGKAEDGGGEIEDKYIRFADPEVQRILAENFSSDGVGMTSEDIAKVTSIGTVFKGNTTIENFDELNRFINVTTIASNAFKGCVNLKTINLDNMTKIGKDADWNAGAFDGCSVVQEVIMPKATEIASYSFANCSSLVKSYMPNVQKVGGHAFNGSILSQSLEIPKATEIGGLAFAGTKITGLVAPCVKYIYGQWSQYAFGNCTSLKNVMLRDILNLGSSSNMGERTFYGCTSLECVVVASETPPPMSSSVFSTTNSTFIIYVPDASVEAYKTATNWSQYSSRIKGISELPIDNPTLYDEIKEYLN